MSRHARLRSQGALLTVASLLVLLASAGAPSIVPFLGVPSSGAALTGIHKIRHVVVIMQENRSFDDYFGTFPGANGIPMANGEPAVCVPDPQAGGCQRPYVDHNDDNGGGPHGAPEARRDIDGGQDGRLRLDRGVGAEGLRRPRQPELSVRPDRRDGLPHADRHPELLELRAELRAPGPHVRTGRVVEPARAPVPGLGVVGEVHATQRSEQLHERDPGAGAEAAAERDEAPAGLGGHTDLRLDRHDLPVAQAEGLVGLLRGERHRARLLERFGPLVHPRPAEREDARHLEPIAVLRHGQRRQATRQHPVGRELLQSCAEAGRSPRCRGSSPRAK